MLCLIERIRGSDFGNCGICTIVSISDESGFVRVVHRVAQPQTKPFSEAAPIISNQKEVHLPVRDVSQLTPTQLVCICLIQKGAKKEPSLYFPVDPKFTAFLSNHIPSE